MERIKQLIGSARYKLATDLDFNYKINLEGNLSPLKSNLNTIISTISQEQVFLDERLKSTKYRFLGRLNIVTDNSVIITGNTSGQIWTRPNNKDWDPLFDGGSVSNGQPKSPNNWVIQLLYPNKIDKYKRIENYSAYFGVSIKEIGPTNISGTKSQLMINTLQKNGLSDGDFCYIYSRDQNSTYTGFHQVEFLGENGEFLDNKVRLKSKYKTNESNLLMKRVANVSDDDINFNNKKEIIKTTTSDITGGTSNANYLKINTGNLSPSFVKKTHKTREGNYIDIRVNDSNTQLNGLHRVEHIIDRYNFVIDLKIGNLSGIITDNLTIPFRIMNGTPSDYYIRKFKLLSSNDYEVNKASNFGSSIYPDTVKNSLGVANDTWLFTFLEDINIKDVYSHRGGELTELYIGTIKRAGQNTFNWSDVTSHWDFQSEYADISNSLELISKNKTNTVGSIEKKLAKISEYYGDFVEYNRRELVEKVLSKTIHRFTLQDSATIENGYYIDPFQQIYIRKFSNIIEVADSDESVVGIPGDAEKRPNGDEIWRDVLEPGYIEDGNNGVDYPFLNGANYIYTNKHIFIRRQRLPEDIILFDKQQTVTPIIVC